MKKLNVLFALFLVLIFAGCKTVPEGRVVDPIELLDNNGAFYIVIPKAADETLIKRIIQSNIKNLSPEDTVQITNRINKIYCSLNRSKNFSEIQAAIDGNIPAAYIGKILKPKNGWKINKLIPDGSVNNYEIYSYNEMDLAFPSNRIACLGRNVPQMLTRYDVLSGLPESETELNTLLDDDLVSYLHESDNEIRFYANKPQSFLTLLTGSQLDLKLIDVKGAFTTDEKHENQYLLNLHFNFRNEKYMKAGRTLLTLAFGLTNSQSIVIGTNELQINGIKLDKEQLYRLLVL